MTEKEFNELADVAFSRIEQSIDANDGEIECNLNGPVMELDLADGSQIIINRHGPNQEIWLATRSGGFHYAYQNGLWISKRDGSELFSKLEELIDVKLV